MSLRVVTALVPPRMSIFEFAVACEVFGVDRTDDGVPGFEFRVAGEQAGAAVPTSNGMMLTPPFGLDALDGADLVVVPAADTDEPAPEPMLTAICAAHAAGAVVMSLCSGAFTLARAGLLDGRHCTTHWRHTTELSALVPSADVDPGVLYVDSGDVITSAGTAAGIDACLHLLRKEFGAAVATRVARRMVVPPQRDGGQQQFIDRPVPEASGHSMAPVMEWMTAHLDQEHTVADLAKRASMSERTFARRFRAEAGVPPATWLIRQRVQHARVLLEQVDLPVESIARRCGFGSAALLRHHFVREVGLPPAAYRRRFAELAG